MNNQSPPDRELLIPIFIGGFSVVGIVVVLLIGRALNAPAEIDATPSATPFQYVYLGTEPAITTLVVEESELPLSEEPITEEALTEEPVTAKPTVKNPTTESSNNAGPGNQDPNNEGPNSGPTVIILTSSNTTQAVTKTSGGPPVPTSGTPAAANSYDDSDSRLVYAGDWVNQTGVNGAYQNTLHISSAVGNTVTFTFTGSEIRFVYQAGPSLGLVTITIDNLGAPPISQAQDATKIEEWDSGPLTSGSHTVVITHYGGGSVNVDKFVIPATATP